jgi:hypothetical protein
MSLPPADLLYRIFLPIPGNDEFNLEHGMAGIKTVSGGKEIWYRPEKDSLSDPDVDPIRLPGIDGVQASQNNLFAAVAPTATDDSASGYAVGSFWFDYVAEIVYVCVDATATAAAWNDISTNVDINAEYFWALAIEQPTATRDKWGANVSLDALMNKSGVTDWTPNDSTLSKVSNGDGGTALEIVSTASTFWASQNSLTAGIEHVFFGRARVTSGTPQPTVFVNSNQWIGDGTISGWQYFYFTATPSTTQFLIGSLSASGTVEFDYFFALPVRASVPVSGERYEYQRVENLIAYSEQFDATASGGAWTNTRCTINQTSGLLSPLIDHDTKLPVEYQGIVGSVDNNSHPLVGTVTAAAAGAHVLEFYVASGDKTWVRYLNNTTANSAYIDVENLLLGTVSGCDVSLIQFPEGVLIRVREVLASGANSVTITPADDDLDVNFIGNASTVNLYLTGVHSCAGELADHRPYVKTTTAAISGVQKFNLEDKTIQEQRDLLGLRERIVNDAKSGIWESPTPAYKYADCYPVWNPEIPPANPSAHDDEFDLNTLDSKWTKIDTTGKIATETSTGFAYHVQVDSIAVAGFAATPRYTQALPPDSTTWSAILKTSIASFGQATAYARFAFTGIYLGDSAANQGYAAGLSLSDSAATSTRITAAHWVLTTGSPVRTGTYMDLTGGSTIWIRLDKLTANAYSASNTYGVSVSLDGITFYSLSNFVQTFTALDEFGIMLHPTGSGGNKSQHRFDNFRVHPLLGFGDPAPGKLIYKSTIKD